MVRFAHSLACVQGTHFTGQWLIRVTAYVMYPMIYQLLASQSGGVVK